MTGTVHDVVIVGGGLAGAATAIHLAEAGLDVAVLERATSPRRKACGEGLFPRGVTELDRLGLLDALTALPNAKLEGVRFHAGEATARAAFSPLGATGRGIQRGAFDTLVLERARAAGALVSTSTHVRGLAEGPAGYQGVLLEGHAEEVRARVIIGADGLRSRLRRLTGLDRSAPARRYGVSAHFRLTRGAGNDVDVWFEAGHEIYITPVDEDVVNVAVLLSREATQGLGGRAVQGYLDVVRGAPPFRGQARGAGGDLLDEPLWAGPFAAACSRAYQHNLVLVGDAAGFLDPIHGEGMSTALVAARLCAEATVSYLSGAGEAFPRYQRRLRSLRRNADLLARVSLAVGQRPALARLVVRRLAQRPRTFERLVGISSGGLPFSALRPTDALLVLPARSGP